MDRQDVKPVLEVGNGRVYQGECIEVMLSMPEASVDAVMTSPPYAEQRKSTYGGIPERDYPAWTVEVFQAMRHILRPGGFVFWNISPHVRHGQLADYMLHTRLALRSAGWLEHDELVWVKPDKMPTGKAAWPVRAWESVHWFSMSTHPRIDATRNGNYITDEYRKAKEGTRSPFQGRDARVGWDHLGKGTGLMSNDFSRGKNWKRVTVSSHENRDIDHPALFPLELARWMVRFLEPGPEATILDPFAGSGTTLEAALMEGYHAVGIERESEYLDLIERRMLRQTDPLAFAEKSGQDMGLLGLCEEGEIA